jgi:hypothetical protein
MAGDNDCQAAAAKPIHPSNMLAKSKLQPTECRSVAYVKRTPLRGLRSCITPGLECHETHHADKHVAEIFAEARATWWAAGVFTWMMDLDSPAAAFETGRRPTWQQRQTRVAA